MTAANISENNNHVVSLANDKILKVAAIYGANASGKTNVYEALEFMKQYVVESFSFGDENPRDTEKRTDIQTVPFIFDDKSAHSPSTYEVYFIDTIAIISTWVIFNNNSKIFPNNQLVMQNF